MPVFAAGFRAFGETVAESREMIAECGIIATCGLSREFQSCDVFHGELRVAIRIAERLINGVTGTQPRGYLGSGGRQELESVFGEVRGIHDLPHQILEM